MIRAAARTLLALVVATTLVSVTAVPAHAGWTDHVNYKRERSVCVNTGETITIGGSVFQQEVGKRGVTRLRVTWLLYTTSSDSSFNVAKAKKTKESGKFPNNAKSHYWNGKAGGAAGGGNFHQWAGLNPTHEYRLVAKMTWVRPNKLDWNKKIPVAYCS